MVGGFQTTVIMSATRLYKGGTRNASNKSTSHNKHLPVEEEPDKETIAAIFAVVAWKVTFAEHIITIHNLSISISILYKFETFSQVYIWKCFSHPILMTCGTLNKQIFSFYSYDTWHPQQTKHPYAFGFQDSSILIFVTIIYIIYFFLNIYIIYIFFLANSWFFLANSHFFWIYELMKWTNFYFYFHDDNIIIIIIILWDNFIII